MSRQQKEIFATATAADLGMGDNGHVTLYCGNTFVIESSTNMSHNFKCEGKFRIQEVQGGLEMVFHYWKVVDFYLKPVKVIKRDFTVTCPLTVTTRYDVKYYVINSSLIHSHIHEYDRDRDMINTQYEIPVVHSSIFNSQDGVPPSGRVIRPIKENPTFQFNYTDFPSLK